MKINIMIIEDDIGLSNGIALALKNDNYIFTKVHTIKDAKNEFKTSKFDLLLLDVNLPDGNGLDFLEYVRKTSDVPVIMLTANDMETDIVAGLEMGANDYVTKPFSLMVLRARVNNQIRNLKKVTNVSIKEIDDFSFDFLKMEYRKSGRIIELSKTEQKLLKYLVENKGNTLSRAVLIDKIWNDSSQYVDENALSVTIKRLRDKLEDNPSKPKYIKTVYGIGYTWKVD